MSSNTLATPQTTASFDVNARFRSVMTELGLCPEDTGGTITFVGEDPIFPSVHRLGACIGIPIMAGAAGIADIWRQRSGRGQDLTLDLRKAIHGINPMYKFMPTINGYPYQLPYLVGNPMTFGLYRTKDGRWFLPTGGYPRMLQNMCTFLRCSPDQDSIANAVSKWDSAELDEAAAEAGLVFAVVRTPEEWAAHPQGKQLADKPLVEIVKIGDSDPEPFTPAARPLSGLRVLSATHVIAGNVMSRTLAEHGAEVLQIAHPEEFEHEALMTDPCAGFTSSAWLDLNQPEARHKAYELAAGADVFVENYRTRKISNLGLSPEELAARRPGIVYASDALLQPRRAVGQPGRVRHGSPLRHRVRHRRGNARPARVSPDPRDERLHRRLPRRGRHPSRPHPPGQRRRQLPRARQPGPLRNVVHVPGHIRQERPNAHRRATPNPGPGHHHRANPLRGTGPTRPTRASSRKPSPIGKTRYSWCAGQARRNGRTADSPDDG